jgi:hypothetical protein
LGEGVSLLLQEVWIKSYVISYSLKSLEAVAKEHMVLEYFKDFNFLNNCMCVSVY